MCIIVVCDIVMSVINGVTDVLFCYFLAFYMEDVTIFVVFIVAYDFHCFVV